MTSNNRIIGFAFVFFMIIAGRLGAMEWTLPGNMDQNPLKNPQSPWSFWAAKRQGGFCVGRDDLLQNFTSINRKDWNPKAGRLMCMKSGGSVWSLPRISVHGYNTDRNMELVTAAQEDPVICWTSPVKGNVTYEIKVSDPNVKSGGGSGNAMLQIGYLSLKSTGVAKQLALFSWFHQSQIVKKGTIAVNPGDKLFFRKTATAKDDFANNACNVAVKISSSDGLSSSNWSAFAAPAGCIEPQKYFLMPSKENQNTIAFQYGPGKLPFAMIKSGKNGRYEIIAKGEKDKAVKHNAGELLLVKRVPETGTWEVKVSVRNSGTDVKGGDGGYLNLTYLPAGAEFDSSRINGVMIPGSKKPNDRVGFSEILNLKGGDNLVFRIKPRRDAYGDNFLINLTFKRSDAIGKTPLSPTPECLLPVIPKKNRDVTAAPIRKGMYWLGCDGGWATSKFARKSIELLKKYIPDLAVIMISTYPDRLKYPAFYAKMDVPTIIQTWGAGIETYLRINNAFDIDIYGRNQGIKSRVVLSGTAHAAALPHEAFRTAFDHISRSAVKNGYSGFGFCDMVWNWGPGRGATGFNPSTIAAFRKALLGEDEGIDIQPGDGEAKRYYFEDYTKFYIGGMPSPEQLGFKSWQEYVPPNIIRQVQLRKEGKLSSHLLMFDLLVHYEWLKAAQFIGRSAEKEGGFFQCMPNPEDLANGCDFLFLAGLKSVYARSEEYFNSPLFINGAYFRFPYFRAWTLENHETGIVLETGHGGNGKPYYSKMMALCIAYEVSTATNADHLEGDFWHSARAPLGEVTKNTGACRRFQSEMAFGLGFSQAAKDMFKRIKPDFISLTSRRIFRPWGAKWHCWNYWLNNEMSPDEILAENGFIFAGRGVESIAGITNPEKMVFYSPSIPTENNFRLLLKKLQDGTIANVVVPAESLKKVIGSDFQTYDFTSKFPEYVFKSGPIPSGQIKTVQSENVGVNLSTLAGYSCLGQAFEPEMTINGVPVVVKRKIGKGTMHVALISPVSKEIGKRRKGVFTAVAIWKSLLSQAGVKPHWQSGKEPVSVRLYKKKNMMLVSAMRTDKIKKQKEPWTTAGNGSADFSLMMAPNRKYAWLAFPSMKEGKVSADSTGKVNMRITDADYQLFYIVPESNKFDLEPFKQRMQTIREALSLDGLVKLPSVLD